MPADLDVGEDLPYQERAWRVQRIGWLLLILTLVAAMLGAFGDGPLARATVASDDGSLSARVQRLDRHGSPSSIGLRIRPEPGADTVEVWIDRGFVEKQVFETIHPEPATVTASRDRLTYEFKVEPDTPEVRISFETVPDGLGMSTGELGVVDGASVRFRQFVFP